MKILVALTLVLAAFPLLGDSAEDVRQLDHEISVATWAGDANWFEENLADEYTLITPGGEVRNKREVIRELALPGLKMEPYDPSEVRVRMFGDFAIVTGRILQNFIQGGNRYVSDRRYTNVYVKRKSRWLLVSGHASSVRK